MHKPVVHMIGQAHLDPVWLWRWQEGRAEAIATVQSAVDRLAEYPTFQFTRGESHVYAWIQAEDPHLFAQIRELIAEGRWCVVNGMVIQPDMNLPQGESLVRQVLLGKRYMQEQLGVEPKVAYCVDSFGHAGTLPQILTKCGFDAYVFMRPGPHEKALPTELFWWESSDGSRLLAFRIANAYQTRFTDHAEHIRQAVAAKPDAVSHTMCFFGVGNHGGGPTRDQIEDVLRFAQSNTDLDLRFSTPDAFFQAVRSEALTADLPTVSEELQFHAIGCYTAGSTLKQLHRRAECSLLLAERLTALAALWFGQDVPHDRLQSLWRDLCFNQFHDILAGSSIKEAESDALHAFGHILHEATMISNDAGRAIAARLDTRRPISEAGVFVVFNPFAEPVNQYVTYEPWTNWESWVAGQWGLFDDTGSPVPHQLIESREAKTSQSGSVNRIIFRSTIPPMSGRVYWFAPKQSAAPPIGSARATPTSLRNNHLTVQLDPATGAISACIDVRGVNLVGPNGWNVAQVIRDSSDTWSHGCDHYGEPMALFGNPQISVIEDGPLQASLLIRREHAGSTWLQQLIIRHDEPALRITNWLLWQGEWQVVKLAFDVAVAHPQAAHDVPFGWCYRPCDGREFPTQMWFDVSGKVADVNCQTAGLAILNDGKYGCDVSEQTMRLTILRSPPYAYHIPHVIGTKQRYDWIDQGFQEFSLELRPHAGDWAAAGVVQAARALNFTIDPITTHSHPGQQVVLPSVATLSSRELEVTTLKAADAGPGYVIRIADRHGHGAESAELSWFDQVFPISVAPHEVVTLRMQAHNGQWRAIACDMLERPL